MQIKLSFPYLYFDVNFTIKKNVPLTELESLLCILVYSAQNKEISEKESLLKTIKEYYNLNEKLAMIFEPVFIQLVKKQILIDEISSNNYATSIKKSLMMDIKLEYHVKSFFDENKFLGFAQENINKSRILILDILFRENNKEATIWNGEITKDIFENEKMLNSLKEEAEKIQLEEIKQKIDQLGEKLCENDQTLINAKINNQNELTDISNIFIIKKDVEFKIDANNIFAKNEISDKVLSYFFKNICFCDELEKQCSIFLSTKNNKSNINYTADKYNFLIDDDEYNKQTTFDTGEEHFIIINKEVGQVKNTTVHYHIIHENSKKEIDVFKLCICKLNIKDIENLIKLEQFNIIEILFQKTLHQDLIIQYIKANYKSNSSLIEWVKKLRIDLDILFANLSLNEMITSLPNDIIFSLLQWDIKNNYITNWSKELNNIITTDEEITVKIIKLYKMPYNKKSQYFINGNSVEKRILDILQKIDLCKNEDTYDGIKKPLLDLKILTDEYKAINDIWYEDLSELEKKKNNLAKRDKEILLQQCRTISAGVRDIFEPIRDKYSKDKKTKEFFELIEEKILKEKKLIDHGEFRLLKDIYYDFANTYQHAQSSETAISVVELNKWQEKYQKYQKLMEIVKKGLI